MAEGDHPTLPAGDGSRQPRGSRIPRGVLLLGWVSLLADVSSEMAYPLVPLLLTGPLGAPAVLVGLIEGIAELAVAAMSVAAGRASDRHGRVWFIRAGYLLPAIGKAVVALAGSWWVLLIGRVIDRSGKGLRTSTRDALLVDLVDPSIRGRAFGLHRAMDTAGAVLGVLAAAGFLFAYRNEGTAESSLRTALLLAAAAGLAAFLLTLLLRDAARLHRQTRATAEPLPRSFWRSLIPIALFGLANSSDAFILLRVATFGFDPWLVAVAYATYQLSAAIGALPAGAISDRLGRRPVIGVGWILYALAYAGLALASEAWMLWPILLLYGLAIACTDGAAKALVADRAPESARGRALGILQATIGITTLAGNLVAGAIWDAKGPAWAFGVGAIFALVACAALLFTWGSTGSARRH